MEKINWGILGTANIARYATIPGMKKAEHCQLYAIAGRSLEKVNAFREEYGFEKAYGSYDELISDKEVQAVYIPLSNNLHLKWVKAALQNGKHVLCEKPLALNANEVKEMFECARANGVYLMEAYAYLHSPYVQSLKDDISSCVIGQVDYIESAFITQGYKEDFRLHKEFGGGALYDLGCYCTTMILSLIDSEPDFVKAVAEFSDEAVDVNTAAIVRFKNGVRASFNIGMILGQNTNSRFDRLYIHGTKGNIRSEVEYNQEGEVSYKIVENGWSDNKVIERRISVPHNYALELEQMNKCILGNATPHITPEFSIKNAELMDRVFKEIGY